MAWLSSCTPGIMKPSWQFFGFPMPNVCFAKKQSTEHQVVPRGIGSTDWNGSSCSKYFIESLPWQELPELVSCPKPPVPGSFLLKNHHLWICLGAPCSPQPDEIHTMLPLAYKDPDIEFCHILLQTMPLPQIFQPPFGFVDFIYTDGSCKHPKDIETRMATYAVVYSHVSLHALPTSKLTDIPWLLDHAFTTVAVSHVQGIQTVDRAELTAAVLSHELKKTAVIVTDSQYVVDCHLLVMNHRDVRTLHKRPNYDLLKRLHALYWSENQRLRVQKIKAHQELEPAHPDFMHRLGNAVADHAAQLAQTRLVRPLTHKMDELRKQQLYFDEHLLLQVQMRADLACMRARLIKDEIIYVDPDRPKQLLYDWNPAEVRQFTISDDLQYVAHASRWGTGYTAMLMAWTQTLQWPLEPDTKKPPTGVSWVELAVFFCLPLGGAFRSTSERTDNRDTKMRKITLALTWGLTASHGWSTAFEIL